MEDHSLYPTSIPKRLVKGQRRNPGAKGGLGNPTPRSSPPSVRRSPSR